MNMYWDEAYEISIAAQTPIPRAHGKASTPSRAIPTNQPHKFYQATAPENA